MKTKLINWWKELPGYERKAVIGKTFLWSMLVLFNLEALLEGMWGIPLFCFCVGGGIWSVNSIMNAHFQRR